MLLVQAMLVLGRMHTNEMMAGKYDDYRRGVLNAHHPGGGGLKAGL